MDVEQRALFEAVVAAPDDLERRRVYGDYLSARGDSRGEHLQLCCDAREATDETRRAALLARAAQLERRDRRRWLRPLYGSRLFDFSVASTAPALDLGDGLLRGISCSLTQLLDSADAISELGALREVRVRCDDPRRLAELGQCSALRQVEHLAIELGAQPPEGLVEALEGPALSQCALSSFELHARDHSLDATIEALSGLEQLRQVERLCVRAAVGPRGARAIARRFARLSDLELVGGAEAVATLATELSVAPRRLRIHGRIGPTAAEALLTSGLLFRLVELELDDSAMGWRGMRALAGSAPELSQLERLALRGAQLEDEAAQLATIVKHLERLRELDLSRSDLTRSSVRAIVACGLRGLESLTLDGTRLGGLVGLSRALDRWVLPRLQHLSLSHCEIDQDGFAALGASTRLGALRRLDLSHSELDDQGVLALARGEGLGGVQVLDLSGNTLGGAAVSALAVSSLLAGLRTLELRDVPIDDDGARALSQSRAALGSLQELTLQNTSIGPLGGRALISSSHLAQLLVLRVLTSDVGAPALDALCDSPSLARLQVLEVRRGRDPALSRFAVAARHGAPQLRSLIVAGVTDACVPTLTRADGFDELETLRLDGQISWQSALALRERFTPLTYWSSMGYS